MKANYISYFKENSGLGQSKLACQVEVAAETSNTIAHVKKALHPKTRHEKTKVLAAEGSELFSQYRLAL